MPHFLATATPSALEVPSDPFAAEYRVPEIHEVGTAAGQVRLMGAGFLGVAREGTSLGGQGTFELMTFAYVGIRSSLQGDVLRAEGAPSAWMARTGPSLHFLPYTRVDLGLFFEGGIGLIDGRVTPVLAPGGTLDLWLSSAWFLHGEAHADWGIYDRDQFARGYLRLAAAGGLGFAL